MTYRSRWATLRALSAHLVDIHAQDQHHALRTQQVQQQIFDEYAASHAQVEQLSDCWRRWQSTKTLAREMRERVESQRSRIELLSYQVEELERLDLQEGEYEHIALKHARLSSVDALRTQAGQAIDLLEQEDFGLATQLSQLNGLLERMKDEHQSLHSAREGSALASSELAVVTTELTRYIDSLQADPHELEQLDQRLSSIIELARKHRRQPESLLVHCRELRAQLDGMEERDSELAALDAEVTERENAFTQAAKALSEKRREALPRFESALRDYLRQLGLEDARIQVALAAHTHEGGFEKVSLNYAPSESLQAIPLEKVASGGERSRLALAVELLAAEHSQLPSLILDEADVGIGGRLSGRGGQTALSTFIEYPDRHDHARATSSRARSNPFPCRQGQRRQRFDSQARSR